MNLESTTSHSAIFLQGNEVPFEVELIVTGIYSIHLVHY